MNEHKISKAYAQTIISLGKEQGIDTPKELTVLTEAINNSNDFETVLFLDVFNIEEKTLVINDVMKKLDLSKLVVNFINFLLQEKRIGLLPSIFKDVIVLDDEKKGFLRGTVEGRTDEIDPNIKTKLKEYIKTKIGKETELEYVKNEKISAGYVVTVGDLQLDASLENQLDQFKKSITD
jgi:F-type H+-transporting ATPase subunit delta